MKLFKLHRSFTLTSKCNTTTHHNNFFHQILAVPLKNQILSNNLHIVYQCKFKQKDKTGVSYHWVEKKLKMPRAKQVPSLPTVAKYVPSGEKEIALIEPWEICHLATGLLCNVIHDINPSYSWCHIFKANHVPYLYLSQMTSRSMYKILLTINSKSSKLKFLRQNRFYI